MTMFRKARIDLSRIRPTAIKDAAMRKLKSEMRKAQLELARRYTAEQVYVDGAGWKRLGAYGKAWRAAKQRRKLSMLRGHASKGIARAIRSTAALIVGKESVTISPASAGEVGLGGASVRSYLRYYNAQKAHGSIGVIPRSTRTAVGKSVRHAAGREVQKGLKHAKGFWKNELLQIQLAVEKWKVL